MRERVFFGVTSILEMKSLPDSVAVAFNKAVEKTIEELKMTPYLSGLATAEATQITSAKQKQMAEKFVSFENDEKAGLPVLRAKVAINLARHNTVPFFFGKYDQTQIDYELAVISLLSEMVVAKDRSAIERLSAAKSLASFSGRKLGDAAISKAVEKISLERDAATDNDGRDLSEALLKALTAGPPAPENLKR